MALTQAQALEIYVRVRLGEPDDGVASLVALLLKTRAQQLVEIKAVLAARQAELQAAVDNNTAYKANLQQQVADLQAAANSL